MGKKPSASPRFKPETERLAALLGAVYQFESQAMKTLTLVAGGYSLAMTTWFQTVLTDDDFSDLRRAISIGLLCGLSSLGMSLLLPFIRSRQSIAGYEQIFSKNIRMLNRDTLEEVTRAKKNGAKTWGYDNGTSIDDAIVFMRTEILKSSSSRHLQNVRSNFWRWTKTLAFSLTLASLLAGFAVVAHGVYFAGIAIQD